MSIHESSCSVLGAERQDIYGRCVDSRRGKRKGDIRQLALQLEMERAARRREIKTVKEEESGTQDGDDEESYCFRLQGINKLKGGKPIECEVVYV